MTLVNHNQSLIFLCQLANLIQRSGIAIHREDTVGRDDTETLCLRTLQAILQRVHISICIAIANSLTKTHTVDNRCVVERIGDNCILLGKERFKDTAVSVEAGSIEDCILGAKVVGDSLLQLFVHILTSADEANRRHSVATLIHCSLSRLNQARVVGETQIVVCTKVETTLSVYLNFCSLWRADYTLTLVEACLLDCFELLFEVLLEISVHSSIWF